MCFDFRDQRGVPTNQDYHIVSYAARKVGRLLCETLLFTVHVLELLTAYNMCYDHICPFFNQFLRTTHLS